MVTVKYGQQTQDLQDRDPFHKRILTETKKDNLVSLHKIWYQLSGVLGKSRTSKKVCGRVNKKLYSVHNHLVSVTGITGSMCASIFKACMHLLNVENMCLVFFLFRRYNRKNF